MASISPVPLTTSASARIPSAQPEGGEGPVAQQIDHRARTLVSGVLQIDAAACVAEGGIAGRLEGPPDRLA